VTWIEVALGDSSNALGGGIMLGENGTEQFTIETRQDGKLIGSQAIHDPFLYNKTTISISRWDLFKAMFRKQFITTIEISVSGTEGVQRAIMTLDPGQLEKETKNMLEERRQNRDRNNYGEVNATK
jgi:hypothetical protein